MMKTLAASKLAGLLGAVFIYITISAPVWGQTLQSQSPNTQAPGTPSDNMRPGHPGDINYIEGQVTVDGQPLNSNSVGTAGLDRGQTLTTQSGKAEILLTPGVFLRAGDNTAVKMISPDLANTEAEVERGEVMVEVTDIDKNNDIRIDENGASTRIVKKGLYEFDADHNQVRVFKGKAEVYVNNTKTKVGGNHELTLNTGEKLKSHEFDTKQYADDLYRWSGLRSGYLAEAGADAAERYVNGGAAWTGTGWYWDPWFSAYTFVPGEGIFYSPFGWGFYSPFAIYGSPYFYGGWRGRHHDFGDFHAPYGHGFEPRGGFRGGPGRMGGFRGGGGRGSHGGGGFHGGGGHGGGGHR